MELSLRGFRWVEAIHSHFPFTLQKTHYCSISHRAKCNLFYPILCLIKKMSHLFAIISSFWSVQLILRSLQCCVSQTILEISSQSHRVSRNPGPTIHQPVQKESSSLLSAVQSLHSGFSDFLSQTMLSPHTKYCSDSELAIDPKISSSIFVEGHFFLLLLVRNML